MQNKISEITSDSTVPVVLSRICFGGETTQNFQCLSPAVLQKAVHARMVERCRKCGTGGEGKECAL